MRLYLVQHAAAKPKDEDPERPLTQEGTDAARQVATFLGAAGIRADRVVHSGKLRAGQTAEILAEAIAPQAVLEINELLNPNDPPEAFAWQIDAWDRDTIVVGHLPFMARLVAHLVTGNEERDIVGFRPGTVTCLEHDEHGQWLIAWMLRPELLPAQ